ncbi:MAG: PAS domain S-box protein [Bacteroidetes bacterium]|nr:PAS domain S-box protein [Bacteroidota bacterium]
MDKHKKISIEALVAEISSGFINPENFDDALNSALEKIGIFCGAGRSYIFLFRKDTSIMDNTHEWCMQEVEPQITELQNLPVDMFPWWMVQLRADKTIHITDVSQLPEEAASEKQILEMQDIKSLLVFPVRFDSELGGFIGFDNVTHTGTWPAKSMKILKIAADIIGNAVQRKKTMDELKDQYAFMNILMDSFPNPVFFKNRYGRYFDCNKAFEDLTGLDKSKIIGKSARDITGKNYSKKYKHTDMLVLTGQRSIVRYETVFIATDGRTVHLLVNKSGYSVNGKTIDGIIGVLQDITERKKLEQLKYGQIGKMEALAKTAVELNDISAGHDLYQTICDRMNEITDGSAIGLYELDNDEKHYVIKATAGFDIKSDFIRNNIGGNPYDFSVDLNPDIREILRKNRLVFYKGNLHDLFGRAIPEETVKVISEALSINKQYLIGLYISGKLFGFISIGVRTGKDIPDRKFVETFVSQASNALQRWKSEKSLRLLSTSIEQSHNIILIINGQGLIEYASRKFMTLTGLEEENIRGRHAGLLNSLFNKDFWNDTLTDQLNSGVVYKKEVSLKKSTKEVIYLYAVIAPVSDDLKRIIYYILTLEDVTQLKEKAQKIIRLNKMLTSKNKELEQIVYIASHDLRSPLINVQGFGKEIEKVAKIAVSLINNEPDRDVIEKMTVPLLEKVIPDYLRYIFISTEKMNSLIAGLMKLSRVESIEVRHDRINMNELFDGIIGTFGFRIKEQNTKIEIGYLPNCTGDELMIGQLFSNLIDNALKFKSPDRNAIIRIKGRIRNKQSVYSVEDNGIGIKKEQLEKVFDIFHKENPGIEGDGLGLALIVKIVNKHSGYIRVESLFGKGTKFIISLPA